MIELPEAITIARQITADLCGKRIADGNRGNSPHKFAFYNRPPEEYETILKDKCVGAASANGPLILAAVEPGYTLILGYGGERIVYHRSAEKLPAKRQLYLHFTDDTYLTVTVQGWGCAFLLESEQVPQHQLIDVHKLSP